MSSNLKVLQVIPKLGYGGAETGCYDIAHYLPENDCGSFIVTSGGELLKFIDKKKVKIIKLPVHSKNPLIIFINFLALVAIILVKNISIVHARSRAPAWSCLLAAKITGRKFVTTFHGTYNFNNKIKKFYNSVMVRSDLIIAGSNFIFSHIKDNYTKYLNAKKKLLVIFRGINVDYFDPTTKLDSDEKKLLKKWQIEKYKKKLIRITEQHRLNNQVKFIDHCNDMALAYKVSDIVISASIEPEAFGRVAVEAQSMEKPIIASDIGGSNETIIDEKTGFLFESNNAKSLSKKILKVLSMDETLLQSIGKEGRKNIIQKFNVEKMCFSTYSEYKRILN